MIDEFPEMPMKKCPDCARPKKLMFFLRGSTYCREHAAIRNAARVTGNPVPADFEYTVGWKTARGGVR